MNTTNLKRKRKDLTFEEKQKLLKLIDECKGCSQRFLSSKYNISLGCINNLIKSRDSILDTNLNMKQKRSHIDAVAMKLLMSCTSGSRSREQEILVSVVIYCNKKR